MLPTVRSDWVQTVGSNGCRTQFFAIQLDSREQIIWCERTRTLQKSWRKMTTLSLRYIFKDLKQLSDLTMLVECTLHVDYIKCSPLEYLSCGMDNYNYHTKPKCSLRDWSWQEDALKLTVITIEPYGTIR